MFSRVQKLLKREEQDTRNDSTKDILDALIE